MYPSSWFQCLDAVRSQWMWRDTVKKLLLGFAVAATLAAPAAFAADQLVNIVGGYSSFNETPSILEGGNDVITFTGLVAGDYNFLLTVSSQYVPDFAGSLNGLAATASFPLANTVFLALGSASSAPFVLTLTGTPGSGALYSGEITVTPVPEPETLALMLGGLGVVGFVAGHRKSA
jgi:hypothetical protein